MQESVLFLASDLAKGLDYSSTAAMTRTLDEDEKGMQILHTLGGNQQMTVITESGFYHAALKSRVEKAKAFRKWVTAEVLPQIRKTGGYIPIGKTDGNGGDTRWRNIGNGGDTRWRNIGNSGDIGNSGSIGNGGFDDDKTIQYKGHHCTRPMQEHVERGLFQVNVNIWTDPDGDDHESFTTMVTPKGQKYFWEMYCKPQNYTCEKNQTVKEDGPGDKSFDMKYGYWYDNGNAM